MSDTEKKPEAVAAATTDDKKKRKTAKVDSYATYIYKVLTPEQCRILVGKTKVCEG